jgi:hypothetical protein
MRIGQHAAGHSRKKRKARIYEIRNCILAASAGAQRAQPATTGLTETMVGRDFGQALQEIGYFAGRCADRSFVTHSDDGEALMPYCD